MPRTKRPIDFNFQSCTKLGTDFSFLRLQSMCVQDIASGKDRCHPQFIEIVKEEGMDPCRKSVAATGWLRKVYKDEEGNTIFILHADTHTRGSVSAEVIERTTKVICKTDGVVLICKYGRRVEIPLSELDALTGPPTETPRLRAVS